MDRFIIRGAAFSLISFVLSLYEVLRAGEPRWLVIAAYALIFTYGIVVIITREKRPEYKELEQ